MSQGEGGGRPRKHPHPQCIDQYAIDAEWQDIADEKSDAIATHNQYGSYDAMLALVDNSGERNNRFAAVIMAINEISKDADFNDIDSLYNCVSKYIEFCYEHGVNITNGGAYAACGVSRQTISEWSHGQKRAASSPEHQQFAKYLQQLCSINREQMMVDGKLNPIIGIWWQKNYDGFTDHPVAAVEIGDEEPEVSESEIAQKYAGIGED